MYFTGFVCDLKNVRIRQVALGKVHVLVLTDKGFVYTFGYNGRGQCGRYSAANGTFVMFSPNVSIREGGQSLRWSACDQRGHWYCPTNVR